jgi:adenine deaminase
MRKEELLTDIHKRGIYTAIITFSNGKIEKIEKSNKESGSFIMPGLIDSHIHIENSMIITGPFALKGVSRGTTDMIPDPQLVMI